MSAEPLEFPPTPETLAAPITPPGRGALATVQVRGPDALATAAAVCRAAPERWAAESSQGRLHVAHWNGPDREQVVVHVLGVDHVELNCHGGAMSVRAILHDLAGRGVRVVSWQELTRRTAASLIETEAIEALAQAPTLRTAGVLLDQFHGALANCVARVLESLPPGAPSAPDAAQSLPTTRHSPLTTHHSLPDLDRLIQRSQFGLHLVDPWRVAIVGRPNVGKSSLLNALVGYDRAIVHCTAGTTRDLVQTVTAVDGWPVELSDSAGIHSAADELESAGVRRAEALISQSDLQLVVLDRSQPLCGEDHAILRRCPTPLAVVNKIDLPAAWEHFPAFPESSAVSAQTGAGIAALVSRVADLLVATPPDVGEPVPFTRRQVELLTAAAAFVRSNDLQGACDALRTVLG